MIPVPSWYIFFCGLIGGAADAIPGISGGTVYFLLGIYHDLLKAIASFGPQSWPQLLRGNFTTVAWKFLLVLGFGVVCSFLTCAHAIVFLLQSPLGCQLLYALFFGLVLGSLTFCYRQLKVPNVRMLVLFLLGSIAAYFLCAPDATTQGGYVSHSLLLFDFRAFFAGILAVTAMLLPGISGSYVLTVMGMYGPLLSAILDIVHGTITMASFSLVASVGLGVLFGALVSAKLISKAFDRYHDATIAILCGFMVGSLKVVWPFETVLPVWNVETFSALCSMAFGFGLISILERLASQPQQQ